MMREKQKTIVMMTKKQEEEQINLNQVTANASSSEIVKNMLITKLSLIFQLFDKNTSGYISADSIDLNAVPAEILLVFKPLLIEMETY